MSEGLKYIGERIPSRKGYTLKEAGKDLFFEYLNAKHTYGCSCHLNPPCGVCTHEGHPDSLEENDEMWTKKEVEVDFLEINREFGE